ncbi:hypothetical protein [Longispora fulva]|uniref:PSer/pThr/pTyr-binding forkhead associated (FHA) protein n=1 Tax=Longispora fulva TaxID=619741 RepID=A0A8J7GS79_9ACTN|nr:hypothetical protein [Longispora fulva]MBG6139055.1 pSer/pThr/pTyr-binding forkhead associated (FHA) protein [Longispora fulva]
MKKWVIALIIGLVVLLICCGVGLFVFYKFFDKATATRSAYDSVQEGESRSDAENAMGSSGLPSDQTKNPPSGTECRMWINRDTAKEGFELCYTDGRVSTKTTFAVN